MFAEHLKHVPNNSDHRYSKCMSRLELQVVARVCSYVSTRVSQK